MNEMKTGINFDRLMKRHAELLTTLQHLRMEQDVVERNTDWLDQAAYENRLAFLNRLNSWYETEVRQIERALDRIRRQCYGICLACHKPIPSKRLDAAPEAEFCGACQSTREAFSQP